MLDATTGTIDFDKRNCSARADSVQKKIKFYNEDLLIINFYFYFKKAKRR